MLVIIQQKLKINLILISLSGIRNNKTLQFILERHFAKYFKFLLTNDRIVLRVIVKTDE